MGEIDLQFCQSQNINIIANQYTRHIAYNSIYSMSFSRIINMIDKVDIILVQNLVCIFE